MKRKWISVVMVCVCLLMCFVPAAGAAEPVTQYDAAAAVSYAAAEWDSGVGVCDQFVKACLAVGGVDIRAGGVDPVRNALLDAGFGTQCELVISADGVHALQSENPGVRAGDVLFFYCEECEKSIHTVMIAGYDADGILYTYGHNRGWDKVDRIGSFRHTPDGGEPHVGCYKYYVVKMTDEPFHAHSFSATDKYESAHPHKMYTDCSCGAKYYLGWNARVSSCTVCNPPLDSKPIATATADLTAGKIVVRWSTVQNATGYALLRAKESPSATYFQIYLYPSGTVMSTSCANSSVELGKTYYYKVVATLADGSTVESEPVRCYMGKDPLMLIIKYIRTGVDRYNSGSWNIMAGYEDADFAKYIAEQEAAYNLALADGEELMKVTGMKNLNEFALPNGGWADIGHVFGSMDITYTNKSSVDHADVSGWAGDTVDLMSMVDQFGWTSTDLESMIEEINTKYFLKYREDFEVEPIEGTFSNTDMEGDLDAFYVMQQIYDGEYENGSLTSIFKNYMTPYEVYRSTERDGRYQKVFGGNIVSYKHASALEGETYYYYVKVTLADGTEIRSPIVENGYGAAWEEKVVRIYGQTRYETSLKIADAVKQEKNVSKFTTVIIASGNSFADALAGSYLAKVKDAPILMAQAAGKNVDSIKAYIDANLVAGGQIYILGGTAAVPAAMDEALAAYSVKRLAGEDRYETNVLILKEAGVTNEEILVCKAQDFADSLSASAVGKPILLVNSNTSKLTDIQKAYLAELSTDKFYIVGGETAVSSTLENAIKAYGSVEHIAGEDRYETSVKIARKFFSQPNTAVLAFARNFPDGLCGGPLALAMDAPLILTKTNAQAFAKPYVRDNGIVTGYVLGGTGLIDNATVKDIFGVETIAEW